MSNIPYVQPKEGQTDEQYMFELRVASIKAGAYAELLKFLQDQPRRVKTMTEEMEKINKQKEYESRV